MHSKEYALFSPDQTLREFAEVHNVSLDDLEKLNPGLYQQQYAPFIGKK